jgi:ABC-type branched-subunit amino acid transport system ATPase component
VTIRTLEVRSLRAGYGRIEVVHGIDLRLDAGEIVAIFGPNGAGKTTTLLTIVGALSRLGGEVLFDGEDLRLSPHKLARQGISLVAERSVFFRLSVEANLRMGRGDPARALEIFPELRPLLRRRAGLLSGGEQHILTMARALAADPAVLLLDEVSSGLAPVIVDRLFDAAREAAERGVGVILVEQQMQRALSVADRVYVLNQGRMTFSGTPGSAATEELLATAYFANE